jgi:hypothetical protein
MNILIEAIKKIQEKYGINDRNFATSLGIDPGIGRGLKWSFAVWTESAVGIKSKIP